MTSPLTAFILKMMATDRARLVNADPARLAAKYGIHPAHAAGYLRLWVGR